MFTAPNWMPSGVNFLFFSLFKKLLWGNQRGFFFFWKEPDKMYTLESVFTLCKLGYWSWGEKKVGAVAHPHSPRHVQWYVRTACKRGITFSANYECSKCNFPLSRRLNLHFLKVHYLLLGVECVGIGGVCILLAFQGDSGTGVTAFH